MAGPTEQNVDKGRDTATSGEGNATLNTSAGASFLQSPDELKEALLHVVKNMGGQRGVRSYLDSFYVKLKDNGADLSPEQAIAFARIYEDHGWKHHANHIRDLGLGPALPTEDIQHKLRNLSAHMPGQSDMVYEFGRLLAERLNPQLVPQGFHMAAELALYDIQAGVDGFSNEPIQSSLVGLPPLMYGLIRMQIPQIAEAIYPEEFAKKVTASVDSVDAAVKEAREKERKENPKQMDIDLQDYYRRVQDISRYVIETVNSQAENSWSGMEDRTKESPNPFYDQIEGNGGIALEMYYSLPSDLHTPLGKLSIGGSGSCSQEAMDQIIEKLGLVEIVPVKHTQMGTYGPVYKITKDLEGNNLPEVIPTPRASYVEYDEAKELWKDVAPDGREKR